MPRVGFFQSVLRQPTRSYANPNAASPWALDHEDDNASGSSRGYGYSGGGNARGEGYQYASGSSRYGRDDVYDTGHRYGTHAGPSRQNGRYRPPPQAFAELRAGERAEEDDYDLDRAQSVRNRTMSESGAKARKPRKAKSTIGVSPVEEEYAPAALTEERLATRFPRAAPKSRSVVGIQDTGRGVSVVERGAGMAVQEGGTVKRKKKRPPAPATEVAFPGAAAGEGRMTEAAGMAADTRARTSSGPSAFTVTTIKPARVPPSAAVTTPTTKASKPANTAATLISAPPVVQPARPAPLFQRPSMSRQTPHAPPSASSSSAQSSRDRVPQTPPDPPVQTIPVVPDLVADNDVTVRPKNDNLRRSNSTKTTRSTRSRMSVASTATGDTVYYTPPTSPGSDKFADSSDEESGGKNAPAAASPQEEGVEEDLEVKEDPETPAAEESGPPRLTIQPPTPAPEPDTSESVFHTPVLPSPPTKVAPSPSPAAPAPSAATGVPKRALSITRPKLAPTGSAPPVLVAHDDDVQSLHAHTGSDDEHQPTSPTPPDAEPMSAHQLSRPPARPPSITHSAPLPPRRSRSSRSPGTSQTHSRQNSRAGSATGSMRPPSSYAYAASDISASALAAGVHNALRRPSREGSIRSSSSFSAAAGFGKGGWAAAAASGSQSGRNSPSPQPAMYMPTGTMDGWEQFHVPPPPRQTKYTPLPTASQPASFERLLSTEQPDSRGGSVRSGGSSPREGSADGRAPNHAAGRVTLGVPLQQSAVVSESSASQYSHEEEEEEGSSSEEDVERPSRSYTVVENPSRSPAYGTQKPRRLSMDPSAPPIPVKSPRRFSMEEPEQSTPFDAPAESSEIHSPQPSESQYSYGSESARDSPPEPPSTGHVPDVASAETAETDGVDAYQGGYDYSDASSDEYEGEDPDDIPARPLSPAGSIGSTRFPRPSFLDPDVLTILPEMSVEDSNNLYRSPVEANKRQSWRGQSRDGDGSVNEYNPYDDSRPGSRAASRAGSIRRSASAIGALETAETAKPEKRPISILRPPGKGKGSSNGGSEVGSAPGNGVRKAKSSIGFSLSGRKEEKKSVHWEGSSMGEGVLMLSDGKEERVGNGYTSLILPAGAYTPTDPSRKRSSHLDHRVLGMPSTVMAALTLSGSASKLHQTPAHLRHNLPPPVDFSSHLPPPNKVGSAQVLVQIYAVGIDKIDTRALEEKGKGEVGKWVPGRSFVGRVMAVGKDEREVVKGELVLGLLDVRKSGALAEYMLVDRRRVTRAPHPTSLTLEQLSLLPLHGLPTVRTIRSLCLAPRMAGKRALIQDAHQGIPALLCQELSRRGVHVTAIISGGENAHEAQTKCMAHGARGVLTGSPAAVMFGLEEGGWDWVVDTTGGERVYDACKRVLRENGKLISLVKATPKLPAAAQAASKPSGFRTLRAAFAPKVTRRDSKHIHFEYVPPAGDGEPEVDARGMDVRDVLEDDLIKMLRPAWEGDKVWNFERGWEAFKVDKGLGVSVVRLIN